MLNLNQKETGLQKVVFHEPLNFVGANEETESEDVPMAPVILNPEDQF